MIPHTLGLGPDVWRVLDACHKQRNLAEYEGFIDVSEQLLKELLIAADKVLESVKILIAS